MKRSHKGAKELQTPVGIVMFVLQLAFLVLLASSTARAGIPRYIHGRWIITEENAQYEDTDGQFPAMRERLWPEIELVTPQDQRSLTTPEPYAMKEQEPDDDGDESAVWKIVLVVAVLLVSVVGSLIVAYYMCVWRGGRIHYQPQKLVVFTANDP